MTYQTFNISLPRDLVKAMDDVAKQEYRNRSDLIREAVRSYLTDVNAWDSLYNYGANMSKVKNIKSEEEVNKIVGNYRKGK